MKVDATLPMQQAVFTALTGNAELMAMLTGLFDNVPQKHPFPYVTMGDQTVTDWDSHTFDGANSTLTIHTWARGASRKPCLEIMSKIYSILHNGPLTVPGFSVVVCRFEFGESSLDPDGQTYHGVQRFRLIVGGN